MNKRRTPGNNTGNSYSQPRISRKKRHGESRKRPKGHQTLDTEVQNPGSFSVNFP
jgi:hypothetical protein